MCIIGVVFDPNSETPFLAIANRDEFTTRPTRDAAWWEDDVNTLGGRDLVGGGSWLAVQRNGRFAALTNFQGETPQHHDHSRGELVTRFIQGQQSPTEYLAEVESDDYAGFNLLVYDGHCLAYLSNRNGGMRCLPPGVYSVSNATLDDEWPKTEYLQKQLSCCTKERLYDNEALFQLLQHGRGAPENVHLNKSGPFVIRRQYEYGTRCSTIVRSHKDGRWEFVERRFNAHFEQNGETIEYFEIHEEN